MKLKYKIILILIVLSLPCLILAVWGSIQVSEFYNSNEGSNYPIFTSSEMFGQTFTIGSVSQNTNYLITHIEVVAKQIGGGKPFNVWITQLDANHKPQGVISSDYILYGIYNGSKLNTTYNHINITFNQVGNKVLNTSGEYGLIFQCEQCLDDSIQIIFAHDSGGSSYNGGDAVWSTNEGASWNLMSGRDLTFKIYGNKTITESVPPNLTINTPLNSSYSSNSITFNITAVDNIAMDSCWYTLNLGAKNYTLSASGLEYTNTNSSIADGSYTCNFYCNDSSNNLNNTEEITFALDNFPPFISIAEPQDNSNYVNNNTIYLNFSVSDVILSVSSCWYNVYNKTSNLVIISNTTIANCQNTTFSLIGGDYDYYLNLYSNDTVNNLNNSRVDFGIRTTAPSIQLNYPTNQKYFNTGNNIYFNYTATDSDGLDTCFLYGNWTGIFSKNYTWFNPNTGIMNYTIINISNNGKYKWNVQCNDTLNNLDWGLTNRTLTVDTINPKVDFITANETSIYNLAITIDFNISDMNLDSCYFTLRNSSGDLHNYAENTSITCTDTSRAFSTLTYGDYVLTLTGKDLANNENSSTISFTTQPSPSLTNPGGGGGGSSQEQLFPVISLQEIDSINDYDDLQRAILYAQMNSYCSEKVRGETLSIADYSKECNLNTNDLSNIVRKFNSDFGINVPLEDMMKFYDFYKEQKVIQFYASQEEIDKFSLFQSVVGLTTLLELVPPSISKLQVISVSPEESYELIFKVSSNKPIAECSVLTNNESITCTPQNSTITIKYKLEDTDFFNTQITGLVNVRTDAPSDKLESRRLSINSNIFNLGYKFQGIPVLVLAIIIFLVLMTILFLIYRNLKPRTKRKIKESFK